MYSIFYTAAMIMWLFFGGPVPNTEDIPLPPNPPAAATMSVCQTVYNGE